MAKDKKGKTAVKPQKQVPKNRKKVTDKWKKKSWCTIVAPAEFERKELGETIVEKPETLIGRTIKVTGRELANQPKKQHIQIKFRISRINGTTAETEAIGHEIKDSFLRRVVRRRSSKAMTVKNYLTKDKKQYKIKIILVTERKVARAQKTSIRKATEEFVTKFIAGLESNKVIDELVFGSIPNKLYPELKKIVPIKRIEITKSALITAK